MVRGELIDIVALADKLGEKKMRNANAKTMIVIRDCSSTDLNF